MKPPAKVILGLRETGFSLIELIIVLLVVGILAMVLLPKMISTTQVSAIVAADLAVMEIRAAQGKAMYSGTPQTITFAGSDYTTDGKTRALPGQATATAYSLVFNSFGEPSSDDGASFQISSGATTRTIRIASLTGKVTIE
ncbi:MAG: prepilin-type N-terminal cleavage/methylation domain-containing protein [Candidatus Erginobacter occultus]|nr:prepilin-type N-terminal cleavage/methylation domain-containing protein [Candidatus Erginobacter occultus]